VTDAGERAAPGEGAPGQGTTIGARGQ
jgi:hypothetical protein